MKIYIYQIWFPTSRKYYIGVTKDISYRMRKHLNANSLVNKALYKYDDWQISILHTVKTRDEANRIEIEEIRNFNSVAPNGYNLTTGGDGISGYKHTEDAKKRMGESRLNNQYAKGYKQSKEQIENSSKRMTGNSYATLSKGTKKPGTSRASKENNPMSNPIANKKHWISRYKNGIAKLEKELGLDENPEKFC